MLRRLADARLRARLDGCHRRLAEATVLVRRLNAQLAQARAEASTNYALMERWKSIAQRGAALLVEERARQNKETTP